MTANEARKIAMGCELSEAADYMISAMDKKIQIAALERLNSAHVDFKIKKGRMPAIKYAVADLIRRGFVAYIDESMTVRISWEI